MTWAGSLTQIKTVFEGLSITSPITETIARVYETPPPQIQDLPCVVIEPPAFDIERRIGGFREDEYVVKCWILVRDKDIEQAGAIVSAYAQATKAAFDASVTLNGNATLVRRQQVDGGSGVTYADIIYVGTLCTLTIEIKQTVTFIA